MRNLQDREDHEPLFPQAAAPIPPLGATDRADLISEVRRREGPPGFHLNIEMRHGTDKSGPTGWFTWSGELITGLTTSPAQRCAAICDLATIVSGRMRLSGSVGWDNKIRFEMLNTDTIIHFLRPPIGAWFAFHAPSIIDERGAGITQAFRLPTKTLWVGSSDRLQRTLECELTGGLRSPTNRSTTVFLRADHAWRTPRPQSVTLVAGNWKMNGLKKDVRALAGGLAKRMAMTSPAFEMLICPPAPLLGSASTL